MSIASIRLQGVFGSIGEAMLLRRAGMAGILFFFVKGLFWLGLPLVWYVMK